MLNTSEIFSTINMIKDQKLDIRTITMGLSLLECAGEDTPRKVYDLVTRRAERLVEVGDDVVNVLQANRQTYQTAVNSRSDKLFICELTVSSGRRVKNAGSDIGNVNLV